MDPAPKKGFASLETETVLERLKVVGEIPSWLSGTLLRIGPAKFEVGATSYRHWFDGLGMLHRFTFGNGAVSYRNRFLQSRAFTEAKKTGAIAYSEFATDPCRSLFARMTAAFNPRITDNANVNITAIEHRFIAMTETPLPIEFNPDTLETLGVFDYGDNLKGQLTTAHPHYDFTQRSAWNYITRMGPTNAYRVYAIPDGSTKRIVVAEIPVREPGYMHSFAITEHYVVIAEFPFTVQPTSILLSGKPFIENFRWHPERSTRFIVVSKQDGSVIRTLEGNALFAFHHINAFEEGDDIVLDLAGYEDPTIINALYLDRLRAGDPLPSASFRRYRLGVSSATEEKIFETPQSIELPRINYRRQSTRPYRYTYGISTRTAGDFFNQIIKLDIATKSSRIWSQEHCYPGEPIFVPSPQTETEDTGVLLSVVLDGANETSFLLVLDAQTFNERARVVLPHHIPLGFHGYYTSRHPG